MLEFYRFLYTNYPRNKQTIREMFMSPLTKESIINTYKRHCKKEGLEMQSREEIDKVIGELMG